MNILLQSLGYTGITPIESHKYISVAKNEPDNINSRANITDGVASFYTNSIDTVKKLLVDIEMQQSGSGDPSPTNVRPISGWTGAAVTRTGANVWGGAAASSSVLQNVPNAASGSDVDGDYVSWNANAGGGLLLFSKFKPETQYTFVFKLKKSTAATSTNLRIRYTDGTTTGVEKTQEGTTLETVVVTSTAGKSVAQLETAYQSGYTYLYYGQCGIFKGVLSAGDFEPYVGTSYPVEWQSEAGTVYGGTLDVTTGLLTVDAVKNIFAWGNGIGSTNLGSVTRKLFALSAPGIDRVQGKNSCSMAPFLYNYTADSVHFYCNSTHALVFLPTDTPAATEFELVANLAAPVTYQLTPTEITTLLGVNNIWADCGPILNVEY